MKLNEGTAVGRGIIQQIMAIDKWALGAWGVTAKHFIAFADRKDFIGAYEDFLTFIYKAPISFDIQELSAIETRSLGSTAFIVRGPKLKGIIIVSLDSSDTYTIVAGRQQLGTVKKVKIIKDIYADDLVRVIDELVG